MLFAVKLWKVKLNEIAGKIEFVTGKSYIMMTAK